MQAPGGGIKSRSPAGRAGSKDGDLISTMASRLQKLETLNTSLRCELKEKMGEISILKDQNEMLSLAASRDVQTQIENLTLERD